MPCRTAFGFSGNATESRTQQILQVPPHAVNRKLPQIVQMQITVQMRLAHFWRVNLVEPVDFAYVAGDVIIQALQREGHVAVFLHAPVQSLQVLIDQIDSGTVGQFAQPRVLVAIDQVGLGRFLERRCEQHLLDQVLYSLDAGRLAAIRALQERQHARGKLPRRRVAELAGNIASFPYRGDDLGGIEGGQPAVAFENVLELGLLLGRCH